MHCFFFPSREGGSKPILFFPYLVVVVFLLYFILLYVFFVLFFGCVFFSISGD